MRDIRALRESVMARSEFFQSQLDRRFESYQLQLDQRFAAEQEAARLAREADKKAVEAALVSAKEAVGKAEQSAEKRFESVNEFRAQLTDQASTFISRNEADTRITALAEKVDALTGANATSIAAIESRLTSRLDTMTGEHSGSVASRAEARLDIGQALQIIAVLISIAAVIFVALHK